MKNIPVHQRWTRRQALRFMAGTAAVTGLHACGRAAQTISTPTAENLTSVSFGITAWIGCTPIYIAEAKNFFQEEGLDLSVRTYSSMAEAFPAFAIGQLQGMFSAGSEAVLQADQGVDFRIVGVMDTSNGADVFLARNSVATINDLRGKRIGVQKGGLGHFFLLQVLAEVGLSESAVQIVDVSPETAAAAYKAGNVDVAYSYPPLSDEANAVQTDGRVIYDTSMMPTAIVDIYYFSNEFIVSNPEAVQGFINGVFKGLEFLNTNTNEALSIVASRLEIEPQEVEQQLQGVNLPNLQTNVEMLSNAQSDLHLVKPLTEISEFLEGQGQIQNTLDITQYIDPQFVIAANNA